MFRENAPREPEHWSSNARFFAFRLLPGQDMIGELRRWVAEIGLRAGYIAGAVGSLSQASLRFAGQAESSAVTGCFEVVSLIGTLDADGEHLHMTISDPEGHVMGGHVMEGCIVRTTMELVIGVLTDIIFLRDHCPLSGYEELKISRAWTDSLSESQFEAQGDQ